MKNNDKPKIGAPKKEQKKTKISITLTMEEIEKANAFKAPGESLSSVIGRAVAALQAKEARPLRINRRTLKPKIEKSRPRLNVLRKSAWMIAILATHDAFLPMRFL